jgi:hypothetical protein
LSVTYTTPAWTHRPGDVAELNLGSAVVPVLLRRCEPLIVGTVAVIVVLRRLIGRR